MDVPASRPWRHAALDPTPTKLLVLVSLEWPILPPPHLLLSLTSSITPITIPTTRKPPVSPEVSRHWASLRLGWLFHLSNVTVLVKFTISLCSHTSESYDLPLFPTLAMDGRPSFTSMAACCIGSYPDQTSGACFAGMANPPSAAPSAVSDIKWYPDYDTPYDEATCLSGGESGSRFVKSNVMLSC